jgi:hypothetical protein
VANVTIKWNPSKELHLKRFDYVFELITKSHYRFKVLAERFASGNCAIGFIYDNLMVVPANKLISSYMASGLTKYWINRHVDMNRLKKVLQSKKTAKVLTLNDLSAGFYVCLSCLLIALIVFILEVSVFKLNVF